jgi:Arc/MetJ family transcription regulator
MTKRLIDLDDELVEAARRALGTGTLAETVRTALREAAARRARSRQIDWLSQGGLAEMTDPDQRETVWL